VIYHTTSRHNIWHYKLIYICKKFFHSNMHNFLDVEDHLVLPTRVRR
jgi:hypothetical protein